MREIQLRDAKASLSAVVDEAMQGKPAVITRHGKRQAVVVSYEEWQRLSAEPQQIAFAEVGFVMCQCIWSIPTSYRLQLHPGRRRQLSSRGWIGIRRLCSYRLSRSRKSKTG